MPYTPKHQIRIPTEKKKNLGQDPDPGFLKSRIHTTIVRVRNKLLTYRESGPSSVGETACREMKFSGNLKHSIT
jgi:hypothetical protein